MASSAFASLMARLFKLVWNMYGSISLFRNAGLAHSVSNFPELVSDSLEDYMPHTVSYA